MTKILCGSEGERVVIAFVAEGSSVDLLEGALGELSVAVGAAEVFRVELPAHRRHAPT